MINGNNKPLRAISFPSAIFNDLKTYLAAEGHRIEIISVTDFMSNLDPQYQYINLVTRDLTLRKSISAALTIHHLDRFTFLHKSCITDGASIGQGSFFYPMSTAQSNSVIENDVIIYPFSGVGHNATVGQGTIIAGACGIGGSTTLGSFCQLSFNVMLCDNIKICDDVFFAIRSTVTKNIASPGRYYNNRIMPNTTDLS